MADLTKAEKAEADRRAGLTDDQRDLEDRAKANGLSAEEQAEMDALEQADRDKAEADGGSALNRQPLPDRKAQLVAKITKSNADKRAKEATVESTVARGRTVYTAHDQTEPHREGDKIMLTPLEHAKLVALGAVVAGDGNIEEPAGPKVYREAGLLVGHDKNQGQRPDSK